MLRLIRREGLNEAYEDRPVGPMVRAGLRNELRVTRHAYSQIACKDKTLCLPRAFPIRFVENAARTSGWPGCKVGVGRSSICGGTTCCAMSCRTCMRRRPAPITAAPAKLARAPSALSCQLTVFGPKLM